MTTPLEHGPGAPAWVDHQSTDPAAARAFYSAVLGWDWQINGPEFGHYANALLGDRPVAGLGPVQEGAPPMSFWTVYLATADIEADTAALTEAGGTPMMPPMQVGDFGKMVVATDPTGAVFGLWQPLEHRGFQALGEPGAPCWFEVNTPDAPRVRDFFGGIWGNETQKMEGMDYYTVHQGGQARHGVLQMTAEWEGIPPHWMVYFSVADVDAAAVTVTAEGGAVKYGPFDTPFGRIAVCQDPQGAVFSLMTLPPQP